jgi:two-component system OmpR family response regulator
MGLGYNGFDVERAANGREALAAIEAHRPDLVVLDVMLPDLDGFDVAKRVRQAEGAGKRVPIIFLTARDATDDKVTGLTLGGDDYVTKPFSLDELVARLRALLRRHGGTETQLSARLTFADIELDDDTHEVYKAGQQVTLSPTEFKLLRYFLLNPGRVLSKAQILDHVWQYDFGGDANIVESYMSMLRRKVDVTEPKLLNTLRGVGYVLRAPRR